MVLPRRGLVGALQRNPNNTMKEFIRTQGLEPFGRFYGLYLGVVQSTECPLGMNQLLLDIPEVMGPSGAKIWAMPKGFFGGSGYGLQVIPQVGDTVFVSYRHGHPKFPVWEHGYFAEGEKPKDFELTDTYGFITPGGTRILIKDSDNSVLVKTPGNNQINIQDEDNSIGLTNGDNITFKIKGKEILMGEGSLSHTVIGEELKGILEELHTQLVEYSANVAIACQAPPIGTPSLGSTTTPDVGLIEWRATLKKFLSKYT